MSNLSFNKNSFIKSTPATVSKPIAHDPNKIGRRTIEEIKTDMHNLGKPKPKVETKQPQFKDIQTNQKNNLNALRSFKEWNRK